MQLDPVNLAPDLVSNAFKCIHSHLFWAKDAIMEYRKATSSASAHAASTQKARIFFDLMSLLEDIELAEGKPDPIELSMLDIDDASKRVQANPKSDNIMLIFVLDFILTLPPIQTYWKTTKRKF